MHRNAAHTMMPGHCRDHGSASEARLSGWLEQAASAHVRAHVRARGCARGCGCERRDERVVGELPFTSSVVRPRLGNVVVVEYCRALQLNARAEPIHSVGLMERSEPRLQE